MYLEYIVLSKIFKIISIYIAVDCTIYNFLKNGALIKKKCGHNLMVCVICTFILVTNMLYECFDTSIR